MKPRIFYLVQDLVATETFLARDIAAFHPHGASIIPLQPKYWIPMMRAIGQPMAGGFTWLKKWVPSLVTKVRYADIAHKVICEEGIRAGDTVIAYWANHVLAIAHAIRRQTGCALEICCHARDIFVNSHLGQVPGRDVRSYNFCCKESLEWSVREFGLDPAKVRYRPHPVPELPSHRGHPAGTFRILNVARDVPKKNLDGVCRMVNRLAPLFPALEFIQIGADPTGWRRRIDNRVEVRVKGTVSHWEVTEAMATSDLFLYGSRIGPDGDRDGVPNVLLEAKRIGLPILSEAGWANRETLGMGDHLVVDDLNTSFGEVLDWVLRRFPDALLTRCADPINAEPIGS